MSPQRVANGPCPELTRSFGSLLVAAAHLRRVVEETVDDPSDIFAAQALEWRHFALHLLDQHDLIVAAVAGMHFTGSAGEHPVIHGDDGVAIPADAGYINVLCRRMEKHGRLGRILSAETSSDALALA